MGRVNSQAKGKRAELDVAKYLTRCGLPARRHVRTGTRDVGDEGDIRLDTAPVTIEVKDHAKEWTWAVLERLVAKLQGQKRAGDLGLLVVKRAGAADPANWFCYVHGVDASRLLGSDPGGSPAGVYCSYPVGFIFGDVVRMLILGDWCAELVNPFAEGV
jgi:hypothetical protein